MEIQSSPEILGSALGVTHLVGLFAGPALFYLVELSLAADAVLDVRFLPEERGGKAWLSSQETERPVKQLSLFKRALG